MTSPDPPRTPAAPTAADHSFRSGRDVDHCGFLYWQAVGKHIECDQPEQDHQPALPPDQMTTLEPDIEAIRKKHWREVKPYDQCHWCDGAWPCHTTVALDALAQSTAVVEAARAYATSHTGLTMPERRLIRFEALLDALAAYDQARAPDPQQQSRL